jgi:hypothetical protein
MEKYCLAVGNSFAMLDRYKIGTCIISSIEPSIIFTHKLRELKFLLFVSPTSDGIYFGSRITILQLDKICVRRHLSLQQF